MAKARAVDLSPSRLASLRQRSLLSLMTGVALGSTGHIAAVTVATIVAKDLAGTTILSGARGPRSCSGQRSDRPCSRG